MDIAALIAFAVMPKQMPEPALWLNPNGQVTIEGRAFKPRMAGGARVFRTQYGATYDFNGQKSGVHFGDLKALKVTDSFTVSTWINPRSYVNDGPGAQIIFRGDDRNGVDPYTLVIHGDGTINFSIQNDQGQGRHITTDLPLNRWSQVVANWDSETGQLKMWLNGNLVAMTTTSIRPFAELDRGFTPGLTIGNVQNDGGPHNQPFNGMLADLRIYRGAWTPEEIGVLVQPYEPPAQSRREVSVD